MKNQALNIWCVIPVYNNSKTVKTVALACRAIMEQVLLIDDGSTDLEPEFFTALEQADIRVIRHQRNQGKGGAIVTAIRYLAERNVDYLIGIDADGQHDPQDIPRLIEKIEQGYDLVVGARQKGSQASVGRGIANALYNNLATYMTEQKVEDLTSGFRAVRADKFREFLYLLPNGFSYPTTSTMAFFRAGYSVAYVPIHAAKRIGKSHIQPLKDGVRFFLIIFKIATLFSPLKMFLPIAVVLFLMGTGWYAYTLFEFHRFTNMSALLYTGSIMIFLMGLISEQITALMYKEK